jgi:hypothetical protein
LNVGDHDFIQHPSAIFYTDAREVDLALLDQMFAAGTAAVTCRQHKPCSAALLKKIRDGLIVSPNVSDDMKALCAVRWGTSAVPEKENSH